MSVKIDGVTKTYGRQKALKNISFEARKGEILGLLGPNGSGKSTLMKIITSFITPDEGLVEVAGLSVITDSIKTRSKIGYLPEQNPLYSEMYVWEYLEFVAGLQIPRRKRKTRIEELIRLTGLTPEQNKKIGQLSKGYRQRVGLAQALMYDPEVLILDEPTTGLDPNQLSEIRKLIKKIGQNKTVILSTHIMQEVEALCDRVVILKEGSIVADQKTNDLKSGENEKYLVIVEFSDEVAFEELSGIEGILNVERVNENWILESSSAQDIRPLVFQFAVNKGVQVLSMNKEEKMLETIFRDLTNN